MSVTEDYLIGLPWFNEKDYVNIRSIIPDPDTLPESFNTWLFEAMSSMDLLHEDNIKTKKVIIRPQALTSWCQGNKRLPDEWARQLYAFEHAHINQSEKI